MSIDGEMNKGDMLHTHTHTGILFSHEKEWNSAIYFNMNRLSWNYTKWNKPDKERPILHDLTHMKSKKKQNRTEQMNKQK